MAPRGGGRQDRRGDHRAWRTSPAADGCACQDPWPSRSAKPGRGCACRESPGAAGRELSNRWVGTRGSYHRSARCRCGCRTRRWCRSGGLFRSTRTLDRDAADRRVVPPPLSGNVATSEHGKASYLRQRGRRTVAPRGVNRTGDGLHRVHAVHRAVRRSSCAPASEQHWRNTATLLLDCTVGTQQPRCRARRSPPPASIGVHMAGEGFEAPVS